MNPIYLILTPFLFLKLINYTEHILLLLILLQSYTIFNIQAFKRHVLSLFNTIALIVNY